MGVSNPVGCVATDIDDQFENFAILKPVGQFEGPNKNSSIQNGECFNLVAKRGPSTL